MEGVLYIVGGTIYPICHTVEDVQAAQSFQRHKYRQDDAAYRLRGAA